MNETRRDGSDRPTLAPKMSINMKMYQSCRGGGSNGTSRCSVIGHGRLVTLQTPNGLRPIHVKMRRERERAAAADTLVAVFFPNSKKSAAGCTSPTGGTCVI